MKAVLLLFDVEQREDATESGALCEQHSPELESQFFHTHRQPVVRSEREVGKLRLGSVPAGKKERGDALFLLVPVNLLNHGRSSRGRRGNSVLTNSELY